MQRMAAPDAMSYWMSELIPNDQFLLYAFAPAADSAEAAGELLARARGIADLNVRVAAVPGDLDRPYWVHAEPRADQVHAHQVATWLDCLDRVGELTAEPLTPTEAAWRLHIFDAIPDAPDADGSVAPATVVVLQISHALGDGRRTSQIARELFGDNPTDRATVPRREPLPTAIQGPLAAGLGVLRFPGQFVETIARGIRAQRLAAAAPTELVPGGYELTRLNVASDRRRSLRVIVAGRDRLRMPERPVTVAALTAISQVLPTTLDDPGRPLGVELTVGRPDTGEARNNFGNVGIDLHTDIADLAERAEEIGADIRAARTRGADPRRDAERAAQRAAPPVLTHWGIRQFDADVRPERVTGVTVVSSVNRGVADLAFGAGAVRFTTGFPALSPAQGLTHGIHGIGEVIALSVTTNPAIMPDVDRYVELLRAAFVDG